MSHFCEAALMTCEDFRLHQRSDDRNYIADFIQKLGVNCDLITRGGGIQDLVRPEREDYCGCSLRDVGVSTKLHNAKMVYLLNHEDCGAYAAMNFASRDKELAQHYQDLKVAKDILKRNFPGIEVRICFAYLKKKPDIFEIRPVL